ncbi:MAG TPA: D-alanyl-D-alanine carboxypeptidase family protein [Stellaceae bacterium]|nr:D-alanyl-D-alanine carboxypeptidase family protein [Stellaceae bacterium]
MSLTTANRDTAFLHPAMRTRVASVMAEIEAADLPLKVFEAWRSPERQRFLYAQGRTRTGEVVTNAQAWESYHQYGLAVDIVGFVRGNWTWDLPSANWARLHEIGAEHGLEWLSWEKPHLQLADLRIGALMEGKLPDGGDASWEANIEAAIAGWSGEPAAPVLDRGDPSRPPISDAASELDWAATPSLGSGDWHRMFGGREWRWDDRGVYFRRAPTMPSRTPGPPTTCRHILSVYGQAIHQASRDHGVPPELVVMTIATETSVARRSDFTGPPTFRWEPHVKVEDVTAPTVGDYSAGPMQTLATSARETIRRLNLAYPDPFAVATYYPSEPHPAPAEHPLYIGGPNIDIGTAEIRMRLGKTGFDPILVAAAYNAGGVYESDRNDWRLRCAQDHLNRAAAWFGDACAVLADLR